MKLRQRIESYWAVWIWNSTLGEDGHWEPYDEGITTKRAAQKAMVELEKRYRNENELFSIVKTTHTRMPAPRKESECRR